MLARVARLGSGDCGTLDRRCSNKRLEVGRRARGNHHRGPITDIAKSMRPATIEEIGITRFQHAGFGSDGHFQLAAHDDTALGRLVLEHRLAGVGAWLVHFVEDLASITDLT